MTSEEAPSAPFWVAMAEGRGTCAYSTAGIAADPPSGALVVSSSGAAVPGAAHTFDAGALFRLLGREAPPCRAAGRGEAVRALQAAHTAVMVARAAVRAPGPGGEGGPIVTMAANTQRGILYVSDEGECEVPPLGEGCALVNCGITLKEEAGALEAAPLGELLGLDLPLIGPSADPAAALTLLKAARGMLLTVRGGTARPAPTGSLVVGPDLLAALDRAAGDRGKPKAPPTPPPLAQDLEVLADACEDRPELADGVEYAASFYNHAAHPEAFAEALGRVKWNPTSSADPAAA
jgi:hypothetical protein